MFNVKNDHSFHFTYIVRNKKNDMYYLGIHSTNNINDGYLGSGVEIKKAINEFGCDSFSREILNYFNSREELIDAERDLITRKDVESEWCYNLNFGGVSTVESKRIKSREEFISHQSKAGKAGGIAAYNAKTEEERLDWHRKGSDASPKNKGMKLKIKDKDAYSRARSNAAMKRKRYTCPICLRGNLDAGNLKIHLKRKHSMKNDECDRLRESLDG